MNSLVNIRRGAESVAFAAIAMTTLAACAAQATATDYKFELANRPASDTAAIALIDSHTGQRVPDAKLFTVKWVYGGAKNVPSHQQRIEPKANSDGTFDAEVYAGETLRLVAHVAGEDEWVRGSVDVPR